MRCLPLLSLAVGLLASAAAPSVCAADPPARPLTRVFYQDREAHTVKWADLLLAGETLKLTPPAPVPSFPALDPEKQSLVQMEAARGYVLVGVRDEEEGAFGSGWVLIDTGVYEQEHGDHSHWFYRRPPAVRAARIDAEQGNPAHLYAYEKVFYLANDGLNGYTRLDPAQVKPTDNAAAIRGKAVFHPGGGGHVTLAAAGGFGYATWIDREGEHQGRIDVTPLASAGSPQIAASFRLPQGGIHGAAASSGKVFFAPSDGVYWMPAAGPPAAGAAAPAARRLDLGQTDEQPRRTGSFATLGRHVAFVTGAGPDAALWLLDAREAAPKPVMLPLKMAEGNRPVGLELVPARQGSPLACVFHDHAADADAPNLLTLVEIDPNGDGRPADARAAATLEVGGSRVEGHGGHHSLAADADLRRAIIANPASGTLSILSLDERRIVISYRVQGAPEKVLAVGGRGLAK